MRPMAGRWRNRTAIELKGSRLWQTVRGERKHIKRRRGVRRHRGRGGEKNLFQARSLQLVRVHALRRTRATGAPGTSLVSSLSNPDATPHRPIGQNRPTSEPTNPRKPLSLQQEQSVELARHTAIPVRQLSPIIPTQKFGMTHVGMGRAPFYRGSVACQGLVIVHRTTADAAIPNALLVCSWCC